ncbi:MAG: FtsX-like permease family protein [Phycisphaerae bacterium]|jgi:putative ABC transport system permease protein|nr:FtsX-like permease family protein [Phycisphaerae bacterium]MBT5583209.1 FtsX-like permease family protein [Phycisphaerae bacterium]
MKLLPFEYAVRNLGRSPLRMTLSIGGSLLVVLLVITASGFQRGMNTAMNVSGAPDTILLIGSGSEESIERSEVPMRTAGIVAASVSGLLSRAGVEAVSPEVHLAMPLVTKTDTSGRLAVLRGVQPAAFLVHEDVRVTHGRSTESGRNELLAGQLASRSLGFDPPESIIGQIFQLDDTPFTVVGTMSAAGGVIEGEMWTALGDLQITAQRDSLSCVVLRTDTADLSDLESFAATRLDLELTAISEQDYYANLAAFYRPVQLMVLVTAVLIAIGGITGGLNTMYAAFASRVREIGALQTLGFSRRAILWSLIQESILASSLGALLACGIGILVIDRFVIRFSMGVFGISVDAGVLADGLVAGLLLGVAGASIPAARCLRRAIPEALRASE